MRAEPVERRPAGLSRALGIGAGALAVAAAGAYSVTAGAAAVTGIVVLAGGLAVGTRRAVTAGAAVLLGAVLAAGVEGAPAAALLVGVGATVFAWDAGGFAVDLGAQLGREAETARLEVLHAAATAAVVLGTAGVGYGVYRSAAGGQPVAALLLLLVAGVVLAATLDYS